MSCNSVADTIEVFGLLPIVDYHKVLIWVHHTTVGLAIEEDVTKDELRLFRRRSFTYLDRYGESHSIADDDVFLSPHERAVIHSLTRYGKAIGALIECQLYGTALLVDLRLALLERATIGDGEHELGELDLLV